MNFNNTIQESNKVFSAIVSKAWEDADFKQRLVSSPEATIEEFTGSPVQLPAGAKLVVNDQTDTSTIHLNIPPQVKVDDLELSDEQLEAVAGGDKRTAHQFKALAF